MEYVKLYDGREIPAIGFGTYKITGDVDVVGCVLQAIEAGYRRIDTATFYKNEAEIGEAVASCGLRREELFLATKLWTNVKTRDDVLRTVEQSLSALRTDYIDSLLIHWPHDGVCTVWKAMEELHSQGVLRAIGLSNFKEHHIDDVLAIANVQPYINQVELHPIFQQPELRKYCTEHSILVEAWSPLMRGNAMTSDTIVGIAAKYGKSAAQVVLRYDVQLGIAAIPKSTHADRIRENIDIFDFTLSPSDMSAIAALDSGDRQYRDPDCHGY